MYLNENGDFVSELSWKERMELEKQQEINYHTYEGEQRGILKGKKETAQKLIQLNALSLADIAKATELSIDEVKAIKSNILKEENFV